MDGQDKTVKANILSILFIHVKFFFIGLKVFSFYPVNFVRRYSPVDFGSCAHRMIIMESYDVIIIGAGPAGTATALFLNDMGLDVVTLDQAKFPRDKVCGEFISPAADPILDDLGVLDSIEALSPCRLKGVAISAYEKNEVCIDYPPMPGGSSRMTSLSLKRLVFDKLMVDRVRESGIEIREQNKVTDFIFGDGAIVGDRGADDHKPFALGIPPLEDR